MGAQILGNYIQFRQWMHKSWATKFCMVLPNICSLTLSLLMSYIYGTPCKTRNFNVVYIWTYVWQSWKPSLSIFCTMFQHWINAESYPVAQLCVNTLLIIEVTYFPFVQKCVSSVWNLLHVTMLVPIIWRWLLHFWWIVDPWFMLGPTVPNSKWIHNEIIKLVIFQSISTPFTTAVSVPKPSTCERFLWVASTFNDETGSVTLKDPVRTAQ
jgi:hypothetical protein